MPPSSKVKAVLFDLGGTLVKTAAVGDSQKNFENSWSNISFHDIVKAHGENEKEFDVKEMAVLGQVFWIRWNLKILERLGICFPKKRYL